MDSNSQLQLVEAAVEGDLGSFASLYERYYNGMVALAYSVLGDRHLAEDAAQEAFAVACGELDRLRRKEKFGSWLAGICRNVSRDMIRTQNKQMHVDKLLLSSRDDQADLHSEAVRRAVGKLGRADRELITLRYYNSFSYAQVAGVLGISRQAVNGRLMRVKRKIAKHLKRNGFVGGEK